MLVPVGGVYTLNGSRAKEVMAQLKPKRYVLPMHYGTLVWTDVLPPDEFLEARGLGVQRLETSEAVAEDLLGTADEPTVALLAPPGA